MVSTHWWSIACNTKIFTLSRSLRSIHMLLSELLVPYLLLFVFPRPWIRNQVTLHQNLCVFWLGQLFFLNNVKYQVWRKKFLPLEWFRTPLFPGPPWVGLFCISNIFSAFTHVLNWPIYKPNVAFLLYQFSIRGRMSFYQ